MSGPLTGFTILDLTRLLPGPYCSMLLADYGARVIKVEEPTAGDYLRQMGPAGPDNSLYFTIINRNKESVCLDLKQEKGKKAFLRLAAQADVVMESFRPGVVKRLGIDYQALAAENPSLIYCSLTGYGQTGPLANQVNHDINCSALSGLLAMNQDREGKPVIPGFQLADMSGALIAAMAILMAVIYRQNTGHGQYLDVAMLDSLLAMLPMQIAAQLGQQQEEDDNMNLTGKHFYYNLYQTKDKKYMSLGALEEKFWHNFCNVIERKDLLDKQTVRGAAAQAVREELEIIFCSRSQAEWVELLKNKETCCEPVYNLAAALEHPQIKAREMVSYLDHPQSHKVGMIGLPIKFSRTPGAITKPAPKLGEHTKKVLLESNNWGETNEF